MISDKQLPSFYIVEATGGAVNAIIPGNLGIESITVGSADFPNDMLALGGLESAMTYITDKLTVSVEETKAFNPEFFPTLQQAKLTRAQQLEKEMLDNELKKLMKDPTIGERKKGDLDFLRVHKFKFSNQEVLLGYMYEDDRLILTLLKLVLSQKYF